MKQTTKIAATTRWDGEKDIVCFVCEFCGSGFDVDAQLLRDHLEDEHPDVEIREQA